MDKTRVLIIDDSAVMRRFLTGSLSSFTDIEVIGSAMDPYIAAGKISRLDPDVITLDIEMPRMDGLTFLSKLMIASPRPVIMVSSLTREGARETVRALELGAADFVCKPSSDTGPEVEAFAEELVSKIRGVRNARIKRRSPQKPMDIAEKYSADVILEKRNPVKPRLKTDIVVAIGASTGGTEVIEEILVNLPETSPGMVITQHMPEHFTAAFASRVNLRSPLLVKEGETGERLYRGMALVAPGGKHMLLKSDSSGYYVEIHDGPPVNRHKPSVDVLFRSVSQNAAANAIGILCTGMGNDGAQGLLEMQQAGSVTITQNEDSCIVYGMPKEAVKLGASQMEKNVREMIDYIKGL